MRTVANCSDFFFINSTYELTNEWNVFVARELFRKSVRNNVHDQYTKMY